MCKKKSKNRLIYLLTTLLLIIIGDADVILYTTKLLF